MTIHGIPGEAIDDALIFNVDCSRWIIALNNFEKNVVGYLIQDFRLSEISKFIKATVRKVKSVFRRIQNQFTI